jgi:hypothetical protein
VIKGDRQSLCQVAGRINGVPGVFTNLLEESEHGLEAERTVGERSGRLKR